MVGVFGICRTDNLCYFFEYTTNFALLVSRPVRLQVDYLLRMVYHDCSMNSKSKKTKDKLLITLIVVVLLAAMTVVVGVVFRDKLKTLTGSTVTSLEANGRPRFMFDTAKFANWTTAGSTYTNPDDITDDFQGGKDDLLISSIVVTQCIDGSNCTVVQEKCKPWSDEKSACKELAKVQ